MDIYVGNLPYSVDEEELKTVFLAYGEVSEATIIRFSNSNKSKGFGFVIMPHDEEANKAIEAMDGNEFQDRSLRVNQAKPREERPNSNTD